MGDGKDLFTNGKRQHRRGCLEKITERKLLYLSCHVAIGQLNATSLRPGCLALQSAITVKVVLLGAPALFREEQLDGGRVLTLNFWSDEGIPVGTICHRWFSLGFALWNWRVVLRACDLGPFYSNA